MVNSVFGKGFQRLAMLFCSSIARFESSNRDLPAVGIRKLIILEAPKNG